MRDATIKKRDNVLKVAVRLARLNGYQGVTREQVAEEARCSTGLISHYFGSMEGLGDAIMEFAIENGLVGIIAEGLVTGHPLAVKAPDYLKRQAADAMIAGR